MTSPEMLRIGKACVGITKTWKGTILIISFCFPLFARRFAELMEAMAVPITRGDYGSDEELGFKP